ncbi:DUF5924 family protein [Gilvimarinus algae]|uniref:DUF5924 family protein n=1 Tax=Gilvimarinus algae TaxID=3058037 RepID=A0ABT8TCB3_9GAMM|nr:DUF5924 family protein [Gilvimarinus sp. SDUM040014]MDO3381234.1 DUF5924 family protein [Gilvimarinus sp. SDUM040014]
MADMRLLLQRLARLAARYPGLLALVGFVSGVASFFLVEREQDRFAQAVALLMLAAWVLLMLENLLKRGISRWFGAELPDPVVRFVTQLVHQESLFFVVPFFVVTTAWNSGQMVFTGALILAAVISVIDPLYYQWLAPKRWLYFFYHGFTLFAVCLTALPILLHIPTAEAYQWALAIAVVLSFLNMVRDLSFGWWHRSALAFLLLGGAGIVGWLAKPWVPPASLWLTQVAVTPRIDDDKKAPTARIKVVSVEELRQGLYAYTAIHAPRGLNERIYHVWRHNLTLVDKIPLDINGGREGGYRAWSHKVNFPPYPKGKWRIAVVTEANQVIGVLRFQVVDQRSPGQTDPDTTSPAEIITSPHQAISAPVVDVIKEESQLLLEKVTEGTSAPVPEDTGAH